MGEKDHWQQHIQKLHGESIPQAEDLSEFFARWRYSGRFRDLGKPTSTCGLCANTGLRYQFFVVRQDTGEGMWVGSECILNFDLSKEAVQARIRSAARQAAWQAGDGVDEDHLMAMIGQLQTIYLQANAGEQRYLRWLVGKFQRRNGFSPKEIGWLFGASLACGVRLDANLFPMIVRTKQDRQELGSLSVNAKNWLAQGTGEKDWVEKR